VEGGGVGEPAGRHQERRRPVLVGALDGLGPGHNRLDVARGQRLDDRRPAGRRLGQFPARRTVARVDDQPVRLDRGATATVGLVVAGGQSRQQPVHAPRWSRLST
jgi:hypothetical protein